MGAEAARGTVAALAAVIHDRRARERAAWLGALRRARTIIMAEARRPRKDVVETALDLCLFCD
jgi:hypothetical protein